MPPPDYEVTRRELLIPMDTVPVTLIDVFAGFGEGEGLLHNEGTHLCLEYQVKDGIFGVIKSEIKQLRIPVDDLVSVTLTKGWFGTNWPGAKLIIQADRMDAFDDMPGASQGRLELSIARKNYEVADDFVYHLQKNEKIAGERPRA